MRLAVLTSCVVALVWVSSAAGQQQPPASDSQSLPRSSAEQQGISSAAILDFVTAADDEVDSMHSFMLVRHGHVVAEGWWTPYDADTPHVLYSLSKSFTSTAVGLAIAEGKLSLDDEVLKSFPDDAPANPSPNLRAMRVRDLLRMSAGHQMEAKFFFDMPGTKGADEPWTKKFLAHPVPFKPGTHFMYNTPATYMLSAMVQKATGQTVVDFLRPRLFDPLGFKNPTWVASPQGISAGGYGLSARTEEIARFGQLYLQKGQWHGRQLVPAAWVAAATSLQTSNGSSPSSDWEQGYCFQFWRCRHNAFRGDGAFGQYCLVMPDQDAVLAITGGMRDMQSPLNLVWAKLFPAMKPEPLPTDADAEGKLKAKLAGLTMRMPAGQATAALAAKVSGKTYKFADNDRGIQSLSLDFGGKMPTLVVRTATGETRTSIGIGSWMKSRESFADGLDRALSVPANPLVAASGAWTADDVFTLKLALCETPYVSTLHFHFDGDRLLLDAEHNVAFSATKLPQLIGQADK